MTVPAPLGRIVVLNGAPRAGKTSIAAAIQERFDGVWMNLGDDVPKSITPKRFQPATGLRPGGERPDLEELIVRQYAALYDSIAAHSRQGLNIVADVGHHDAYSLPRGILPACARRLAGLPALLVGVRCPLEVIMRRRQETWGRSYEADGSVPGPVALWQKEVHRPGVYDLEVDTSALDPAACAERIRQCLEHGPPPSALARLAAGAPA